MNTTLSKILIFAAGAAIGSAVTYKLIHKQFKDEYEQKLAKDSASIKEAFSDANFREVTEAIDKINEIEHVTAPKPTDVKTLVHDLNYILDEEPSEVIITKKGKTMDDVEPPCVIDPQEFAEYADYDNINLYYYTDDILADDMDNVVDDVEDIVGSYALTTFGMYEDEAVHVRNDRKKCYYEILRCDCAYSEKYGLNLREKED